MSRFFQNDRISPYVPGEQPKDRAFVKLNTNESPFPPYEAAVKWGAEKAGTVHLYSDPTADFLRQELANALGVPADCVTVGNGSDEILDFVFDAFCSEEVGCVFPDITYGLYSVLANRHRVSYRTVALEEDFSLDHAKLYRAGGTVLFANPNAPTGIALPRRHIEKIVRRNPENVVVVDEAYVDFGAETAVPLTQSFDNVLVVGTFSKSRSMAGARLGYAVGCPDLIRDLEAVRNSTNPYNVNAVTQAMGLGTLLFEKITKRRCAYVAEVRDGVAQRLTQMGFSVLPSKANFLFARYEGIGGAALAAALREKGFLVRHFASERICDFVRISIGRAEDMQAFLGAISEILQENAKKD